MIIPTALVVATLTLLSEAAVVERRNHMPAIWKRSAQPNPDTIIPLRFGLAQGNLDHAHGKSRSSIVVSTHIPRLRPLSLTLVDVVFIT